MDQTVFQTFPRRADEGSVDVQFAYALLLDNGDVNPMNESMAAHYGHSIMVSSLTMVMEFR
jgi:hypothetical protein